MKTHDALNNIFDVEVEVESTEIMVPVREELDDEVEDDFKHARSTIKTLIDSNNRAVESLQNIAIGSENPEAFSSLAQLTKTQIELTKMLLDAHKKKRDLTKPTEEAKPKSIETQNNLFVGSTSELMDALRNKNNG